METAPEDKKKAARKATYKRYYEKHKESIKAVKKAYSKIYYERNKESIKPKIKTYRIKNSALIKTKNKKYQEENSEKIKFRSKEYYRKNSKIIKTRSKSYREKNVEDLKIKQNDYVKKRLKTDPIFKMVRNLRRRLLFVLNQQSGKKGIKTLDGIGCTPEFLKNHLEAQFKEDMTWENHGLKGWHVDHIKPCSAFDLNNPEEQKMVNHYTNLQPLWWYENLSKGDKILQ